MKGRLLKVVALSVLAGAVALACGEDDNGTGPEDGVREIQLQSSVFNPATVTIDAGTTVRWIGDGTPHTITPDDPDQEGVWTGVEVSGNGVVLQHTFNVAGQTYEYTCLVHPQTMTGTIVVRSE